MTKYPSAKSSVKVSANIAISVDTVFASTTSSYTVPANSYAIVQISTNSISSGSPTHYYSFTGVITNVNVPLGTITQALYVGPGQTINITVTADASGSHTNMGLTGTLFTNS